MIKIKICGICRSRDINLRIIGFACADDAAFDEAARGSM